VCVSQTAEGCVNWTKLVQILKATGTKCQERKFISKLYTDQSVKLKLDQYRQVECRLEEELDKDTVCHCFCSICRAKTLPIKLLKGMGASK